MAQKAPNIVMSGASGDGLLNSIFDMMNDGKK